MNEHKCVDTPCGPCYQELYWEAVNETEICSYCLKQRDMGPALLIWTTIGFIIGVVGCKGSVLRDIVIRFGPYTAMLIAFGMLGVFALAVLTLIPGRRP